MDNKYKQALEKIKEVIESTGIDTEKFNYTIEAEILDIATQALAPQECDVTQCYFNTGDMKFNCTAYFKETGANEDCNNINYCYYKQLHSQEKKTELKLIKPKHCFHPVYFRDSFPIENTCKLENCNTCSFNNKHTQEKTFTVEEIKRILISKSAINKKSGKATVHLAVTDLLAEFKKEVG